MRWQPISQQCEDMAVKELFVSGDIYMYLRSNVLSIENQPILTLQKTQKPPSTFISDGMSLYRNIFGNIRRYLLVYMYREDHPNSATIKTSWCITTNLFKNLEACFATRTWYREAIHMSPHLIGNVS